MADYKALNLGEPPAQLTPGQVELLDAGPGREISFPEAVSLAESAMNRISSNHVMAVLSVCEMEWGWVLVLQSKRYLETRQFRDQIVGHGVTLVDRKTGAVYGSGSATPPWSAIAG